MKYIYQETKEVEIGDTINWYGMSIIVTKELITQNPNQFKEVIDAKYVKLIGTLFDHNIDDFIFGKIYKVNDDDDTLTTEEGYRCECKIGCGLKLNNYYGYSFELSTEKEYNKQELLLEISKKYPVGTIITSACNSVDFKFKVTDEIKITDEDNIYVGNWHGKNKGSWLKYEGVWATIFKPFLTTEDGVEIFDNDSFWATYDYDKLLTYPQNCKATSWFCDKHWRVLFSSEEKAAEYIKKNTKKTLWGYERSLTYNIVAIKNTAPSIYWLYVLQMIANDLNDGWVANWNTNYKKYFIVKIFNGVFKSNFTNNVNGNSTVYFKSKEASNQAIEIMGDNIKHLFN